ncbi:MAG: hypothetical protein JO361_10125 [Gammaproteobacteria bacterium]|nr:hypothetical protein [Gammaproteobacteria bacterium]
MPKAKAAPLTDKLLSIPKGDATATPEPGKRRRQPGEERVSMTFRLKAEHYEHLRRAAFEAHVSQQALLDEALEKWMQEGQRRTAA